MLSSHPPGPHMGTCPLHAHWPLSTPDAQGFQSLLASLHMPLAAELILAALAALYTYRDSAACLSLRKEHGFIGAWWHQALIMSTAFSELLTWSCKLDADLLDAQQQPPPQPAAAHILPQQPMGLTELQPLHLPAEPGQCLSKLQALLADPHVFALLTLLYVSISQRHLELALPPFRVTPNRELDMARLLLWSALDPDGMMSTFRPLFYSCLLAGLPVEGLHVGVIASWGSCLLGELPVGRVLVWGHQ